ncbi:hypothetical protein MNBD_NITROSPINAE02-514 [hydrothermal vent metagenome]|uniref:NodB homology domain-containing protein n=1 Tax=hydrothermal vent metagenome TaxID=652676 RepID=A0A3B1BIY6_9ZZZZ
MNFYAPQNHLAELRAEWDNFQQELYPDFVTRKRPANVPDKTPVFSYHDIDQQEFEAHLEFLKRNGYKTVTADEYLDRGEKAKGERVVMLTFDDGYASVWKVAYPLLKKYGMKGVAFILPGETKEAEAPRGAGDRDDTGEPLCTWPELEAMRGVVDVQSHSLYHFIMFTSDKVEIVYDINIKNRWPKKDLPLVRVDGVDDIERSYPLGSPFYGMDSRLSDVRRLFTPAETSDPENKFREESGSEQEEAVRACFVESKKIIEGKLPGHSVSHFCLPFSIGGRLAIKSAIEAGYRALYWGVTPPVYAAEFPEIRHVTRIKSDYIYRLPGDGRKSVATIFLAKFMRRFI